MEELFEILKDFNTAYMIQIPQKRYKCNIDITDKIMSKISPVESIKIPDKCKSCYLYFIPNFEFCYGGYDCPIRPHPSGYGCFATIRIELRKKFHFFTFEKNKWLTSGLSDCSFYYFLWLAENNFPIFIASIEKLYDSEIHHFFGNPLDSINKFHIEKDIHKIEIMHSFHEIGREISKEILKIYTLVKDLEKNLSWIIYDINGLKISYKDITFSLLTISNQTYLGELIKKLSRKNNVMGMTSIITNQVSIIQSIQNRVLQLKNIYDEFVFNSYKDSKIMDAKQMCIDSEKRIINRMMIDVERLLPYVNDQIELTKGSKKDERTIICSGR